MKKLSLGLLFVASLGVMALDAKLQNKSTGKGGWRAPWQKKPDHKKMMEKEMMKHKDKMPKKMSGRDMAEMETMEMTPDILIDQDSMMLQ